ncbi:substrate-binding domain-containing protein [Curtobacterium sp. MCPF17_052]|uniref:substrate-binding domain-containing protein n=1 Tax=Curtobacterium sp. MCPF17_052 TaxID=2175655 RepID=UPI0024DFDB22|nr:substrate-binding domain-containing protein [Curtobacterium sp. MCPF17_052]WIB13221.1 substrate-binding domain-containing protein [Curtobacterium sp. MCPF17_052]
MDAATVDAVFAGNDQMALGVLHAFAEEGLRVPDDIAVIGFDDVPEAAHFTPPLTTVRQDFQAMGGAGPRLGAGAARGRAARRRAPAARAGGAALGVVALLGRAQRRPA